MDAIATAVHPGASDTNLVRHVEDRWYMRLLWPLLERMAQSAAMGALPTIRAAVDPTSKGGDFYGPDGSGERTGYPVIVQSSEASHNKADARRLWEISEELTGIHYNWNN